MVIEELYFIAAVRLTKKSEGSTKTGVTVIPCFDFRILFLIDSLVASEIVKDENGFNLYIESSISNIGGTVDLLYPNDFDYTDIDALLVFEGKHPGCMQERIRVKNWDFRPNYKGHSISFKNRLLYWFEEKTSYRLGEYKNYTLI